MTPLPPRPAGTQLRARRSPRLIVLGVLLACLGALGAVAVYQTGTTAQPVLVMRHTVNRGDVIPQGHVQAVDVTVAAGMRVVPAASMSEVVGKVALTDLEEGSLVTPDSFGAHVVEPETVQVGLRLGPGRLPVRSMPPGTRVNLIGLGDAAAAEALGPGTVVTAARETPDGAAQVLDVSVAVDVATKVAQLAANDRLVVVRVP
ncbi:MAG: SAF domain-containing protein [Actinomycetia bacterium]|nr:SAF domain-containing protein [Actinomycetes bacterium]